MPSLCHRQHRLNVLLKDTSAGQLLAALLIYVDFLLLWRLQNPSYPLYHRKPVANKIRYGPFRLLYSNVYGDVPMVLWPVRNYCGSLFQLCERCHYLMELATPCRMHPSAQTYKRCYANWIITQWNIQVAAESAKYVFLFFPPVG